MNVYDDYFGGMTPEEYEKEMEEHFKFIDHICKCDYNKSFQLLNKFKENLFAIEFVSDEEAEMLYHTILNWKDKTDMYDDLCDWEKNIMSDYSAKKYIEKKLDDLYKETTTNKAFNLGMAVGMYQSYKGLKINLGKEYANKCFSDLNKDDDYTTILRTLIELDNKDAVTSAEKILEHYENMKKPNVIMSDEHRELLEQFMEFLYKKDR